MSVYLIRHAKAGSRSSWDGDDRLRPLSKSGRRQAEAIADRLGARTVPALHSSPYIRCRQTLEPLAARLGLEIADEPRLAEASRFEEVLDLLASVADETALCSHGDVIPETIAALERRGCHITGDPDWRKGTVWTLERSGDGWFERASVWLPSSD
ncbi:MAG: histidine phosphatase family protein [Ilumatobacteraceae bacterium]